MLLNNVGYRAALKISLRPNLRAAILRHGNLVQCLMWSAHEHKLVQIRTFLQAKCTIRAHHRVKLGKNRFSDMGP
jgi:hypothetical protein